MSPYDYLAVDRYLTTDLDTRALHFAFRSGLIERLQAGSCAYVDIPLKTGFGKRVILDLLEQNRVIVRSGDKINLDDGFRKILVYRDLIESRIDFADYVATDIAEHFADLIDDLPAFMTKSRTFALFRYDRCFAATAENIAATRRWMRYTTALTRCEGRVLASLVDFGRVAHVLDVGGNSGELALQLCAHDPELRVTVVDLPVVCQIGRAHVDQSIMRERIVFEPRDFRRDDLPAPQNAVVFKSVLHDWPGPDATMLLRKAFQALAPGGQLVIFERGEMRFDKILPYAQYSNLVFAPFFRPAAFYRDALVELGFVDVEMKVVALEMDFHLVVARRPI